VDHRDRHLHAVGRGGPQAGRLVLRRVVAAQHRLLLLQHPRAGPHVVVEHRPGRDHGLVAEPQHVGVELEVGIRRHRVDGLGLFDLVDLARLVQHPNPPQPLGPLPQHDPAVENLDAVELDLGAMGDHVDP
jgi:hypothetical protein